MLKHWPCTCTFAALHSSLYIYIFLPTSGVIFVFTLQDARGVHGELFRPFSPEESSYSFMLRITGIQRLQVYRLVCMSTVTTIIIFMPYFPIPITNACTASVQRVVTPACTCAELLCCSTELMHKHHKVVNRNFASTSLYHKNILSHFSFFQCEALLIYNYVRNGDKTKMCMHLRSTSIYSTI